MTNEPEESQQVQEQPNFIQPDWFLQMLVKMVNASDAKIGVTLQVSGFLVSGYLVGGASYFDGFAAAFASGLHSDQMAAETIRKAFSSYGERIYKSADTTEDAAAPLAFIHLKDARFFNTSGKPIPANGGVWWRGRLSEVSGFVLGSLSEGS
jgi:hypothetical protein